MDRVLCGASSRNMKYYFNEEKYGILPGEIRDMLKAMLCSYCADAGGIIILAFDEDYRLRIHTIDPIDEIGSELLIKRIQAGNAELFESLEKFAEAYDKL